MKMFRSGIDVQHPGSAGYKKMVRRFCGKSERFWELDFARGICVLLMVFDHFMYCLFDIMPSLNEMFGTSLFAEAEDLAISWWLSDLRVNGRLLVITAFFLLCGISSTLTRGNFRRCIPLALVAAGISAVTAILEQWGLGMRVLFGVIHMLAAGIFLYAVFDEAASAVGALLGKGRASQIARNLLRLLPGVVGAVLLIWYFTAAAQFTFTDGQWEIISKIPAQWSEEENILRATFVYLLNFRYPSGDYFPILPWAAVVLAGGIIGRLVYHTDARYAFSRLDGAWNSGFCFLGRHAAVIYIAHMVVIPVLFAAAAFCVSLFV